MPYLNGLAKSPQSNRPLNLYFRSRDYRQLLVLLLSCFLIVSIAPLEAQSFPTLADFWEGRADWFLEIADVGLPVGESDTIQINRVTPSKSMKMYFGLISTPVTNPKG